MVAVRSGCHNPLGIYVRKYVCPLSSVDIRLSDAHNLWHKAVETYFDPEEFRLNAQNCIQTLRTVTFVLQANKAKIRNFDTWYACEQDLMRADGVLKWLVNARNNIEKRGDLRRKSFVKAEIIASYLDNGPRETVETHLFEGPEKVFSRIPHRTLREHAMAHGVLLINRQWVHDSLPDFEVTEALAHAYGKISSLVKRTHIQAQLPAPRFSEDVSHEKWLEGRLPCMVGHEGARTIMLSLRNGAKLSFTSQNTAFTEASAKQAEKRYGAFKGQPTDESPLSQAHFFFGMARKLFTKDKHHSTIAILLSDESGEIVALPARDRQEKYLQARQLALQVRRKGASTLIFVGEAWTTSFREGDKFDFPADDPSRKEVLSLAMIDSKGTIINLHAEIKRKSFGRVELGATYQTDGFPYFLAPVREVWNLKSPDEHAETR